MFLLNTPKPVRMHKHVKRTTQCTATPDHRYSCHSFSDVVLVVLIFIVLWCQECKVDTDNFLHIPPEDDFEILFSAEQTGRILSIRDSKSIQIDAKLLSYKFYFWPVLFSGFYYWDCLFFLLFQNVLCYVSFRISWSCQINKILINAK